MFIFNLQQYKNPGVRLKNCFSNNSLTERKGIQPFENKVNVFIITSATINHSHCCQTVINVYCCVIMNINFVIKTYFYRTACVRHEGFCVGIRFVWNYFHIKLQSFIRYKYVCGVYYTV